jgi:hypothetical protein
VVEISPVVGISSGLSTSASVSRPARAMILNQGDGADGLGLAATRIALAMLVAMRFTKRPGP